MFILVRNKVAGHPRLMQLTIGPSIYGVNWFRDLKLRIADIAEEYQNTTIYGVGINLYGAEKPDYLEGSRMEPDVLMSSIWEIVKEQPGVDQETARLRLIEEDLRGMKDEVQGYHQSKDETQGNHQSKDETRLRGPQKDSFYAHASLTRTLRLS